MSGKWKARLLVTALVLVAGMGCNPVLLLGYLIDNDDPKAKAEYPLKPQPKHEKEEVKVVVLTSCAPGISSEMIGIDKLLSTEIIPLLETRCTENKEKVKVLKSAPLDKYKRENPDWRSKQPVEFGEYFKADYVIDIEVRDISLYEPGTHRELMQGRATVQVTAYDMSKPLKEPSFAPPEMNFEFPKGHPVLVLDEPVTTFRQRFIKRIANDVVLPFTAHTSNQRIMVD
jgi:hypothetical protein